MDVEKESRIDAEFAFYVLLVSEDADAYLALVGLQCAHDVFIRIILTECFVR